MSNKGFARTENDLWLRDTRFPNEAIVKPSESEDFTNVYIKELNLPPNKEYNIPFLNTNRSTVFHDQIETGMFVWPTEFVGYKSPSRSLNLEVIPDVRSQLVLLAPTFNREWVHQQLQYLQVESSKTGSGLRGPDAHCWPLLFRLFRNLEGAITEDEIREEIVQLLGDGRETSQQATFEVVFALIMSLKFAPNDYVQRTWNWLLPFLLKIFETMLRPDNVGFWRDFLTGLLV